MLYVHAMWAFLLSLSAHKILLISHVYAMKNIVITSPTTAVITH